MRTSLTRSERTYHASIKIPCYHTRSVYPVMARTGTDEKSQVGDPNWRFPLRAQTPGEYFEVAVEAVTITIGVTMGPPLPEQGPQKIMEQRPSRKA